MSNIPPHNLEAEGGLLGTILTAPETFDEVADTLRSEHFYADANRRVYETIVTLRSTGRSIDVVLIRGVLAEQGRLGQVGGAPYLAQLATSMPYVAKIRELASIIKEKWRLRQAISICQTATAQAYTGVEVPSEFLGKLEQSLADVAHESEDRKVEAVGTIGSREIRMLSDLRARGETISGVSTGLFALDHQTNGLFATDLTVIAARAGLGKAQPHDARVLTPEGWRTMGSLAVGDLVVGADGKPTEVLGVYERGELDIWRVELDDGCSTECCGEHLWSTRTSSERKRRLPATVRTTDEIRNSLFRSNVGGRNHSLPYVTPVEFAATEALMLHPYLLGVYLGDGCSQPASVVISNPEPDIQCRLGALVPQGDAMRVTDAGKTIRIRRAKKNNKPSHTRLALEALGLHQQRANGKFIPTPYLRASIADRVALLRGLCDTDGYVVAGNKGVEYVTVSPQLRDDIIDLVGGLGGFVSCATRRAHYKKDGRRVACQDAHRLVIYFADGLVPVSSAKHLRKWDSSPHRVTERFVKSVEPAGRKGCRCIRVAAQDGLYVTDGYIVTHNTSFAVSLACGMARPKLSTEDGMRPGDGVLFCSLEQPREQLMHRMASHEGRFDSKLWRKPRLREDEWLKVQQSWNGLEHLPIWVDDQPLLTVLELRAKFRRLRREVEQGRVSVACKGLKIVVVDYIQLMKGIREKGDTREREIASLSAGLKNFAKQEHVIVIALAQVNRAVEKQKDKRPVLADLRESGAIEADADNVWFLYRESYYDRGAQDQTTAEIDIAKQRNGPTGTIEVHFTRETGRFENLAGGDYGSDDYDAFDAQ